MNDFNENDPFFNGVLWFVGPLLIAILAFLIWFSTTEDANVTGLDQILIAGGIGAAIFGLAYFIATTGIDWISEWWKGQR